MNCCDYECTRAPNCPAGSKDTFPDAFPLGAIIAQRLLSDERLPELEPYEFGRGMFLFNTANSDGSHPEADTDESILTTKRVLIGCGIFLAVCVAVGVASLNYWR